MRCGSGIMAYLSARPNPVEYARGASVETTPGMSYSKYQVGQIY
jgi:hypothetical protein